MTERATDSLWKNALTTWTASVEAQVKEQVQRLHQEQAQDVGRGVEMFVTKLVERKWEERETIKPPLDQSHRRPPMLKW
eukprot:11173119-Prorocentrum_lima.AAC.1